VVVSGARPGPGDAPDVPTLAEVYEIYADFVMRCARHMRVEPQHVEDVVHDVFLVVHARLADFDPARATLRSWLYGILRRVVSHHRRGDRRARRRLSLVPPPPEAPAPDEEIARLQAADLVDRFVASLDDKRRPVFTLAEIEGMSAPEIARCLDVKLNTVYSRLRLARRDFDRFVRTDLAGPDGAKGGAHGAD
jgi:RNA polymerase sigma-70 factor (ECF subfamily)